jgi:hypothetical protein
MVTPETQREEAEYKTQPFFLFLSIINDLDAPKDLECTPRRHPCRARDLSATGSSCPKIALCSRIWSEINLSQSKDELASMTRYEVVYGRHLITDYENLQTDSAAVVGPGFGQCYDCSLSSWSISITTASESERLAPPDSF